MRIPPRASRLRKFERIRRNLREMASRKKPVLRHRVAMQRRQSLSPDQLGHEGHEQAYRVAFPPPPKLHQRRFSHSLPDFQDIITINVSGRRFQTLVSTLSRFPHSLLGDPQRLAHFYNAECDEYFFDRNRYCFEPILELFQTGEGLIRPANIPIKTFMTELFFYDLGLEVLENFLTREGLLRDPVRMPRSKAARIVFELFEFPDSGLVARSLAVFNIIIILISIASFCAQTLPEFQLTQRVHANGTVEKVDDWSDSVVGNPFFRVEAACTAWFTLDLVVRFLVSPNKRRFLSSPLNIIDLLSILPFYIALIMLFDVSDISAGGKVLFLTTLRILRIVKVFRVFKLGRYSTGLQVYALTLHAARYEVALMIFVASIGVVVFSAAVYFAEQGSWASDSTQFVSIPTGFWYSIVTWTTVGYGDMVPKSVPGKVVGGCCAICGILGLSFMVPVVVAYFEHFFYRARDMEKLEEVFKEVDRIKLSRVDCDNGSSKGWVSLQLRRPGDKLELGTLDGYNGYTQHHMG